MNNSVYVCYVLINIMPNNVAIKSYEAVRHKQSHTQFFLMLYY